MSDTQFTGSESIDAIDEKALKDILNGLDDDLINRQIEDLLGVKGEYINMDNVREKAFNKLEKEKKKRGFGKKAAIAAAVAALTVSTVYAKDIQSALQSFFGKSTVYQTVVDGDAYYLPEKLALGDKYMLRNANMSEGSLELAIESTEEMSDEWYENLELSVAKDGKSYEGGGYGYSDGALNVSFYKMPTLANFDISIDGEVYPVSLTKAESLAVDENLIIGVAGENGAAAAEALPLIANVAASRNDEGSGVGINIAVGFDDRDLKLSALGKDETGTILKRMFQNDANGILGSGNRPQTKPLTAYDANGNAYELKEPEHAVGSPVTVFETDAAPETPLTLKVPAIYAHYEKEVDRIKLPIPADGETELGEEIDFIIQKAMVKSIKRTSETTAEITFDLNTGADKSVKICDIAAYSSDVTKGETVITGNTAVLTLTFDKGTTEAEIEFSWPYFIIDGDWSVELN